MAASDLADYYDELCRWTAIDRDFQVYSGLGAHTIHRFLIDEATAEFSPATIYKFIDPHVAAIGSPRGLDAGCGYGGTIFHCIEAHGGLWEGITISQEQVGYARSIATARGVDGMASFHLSSYDATLPGRYNVIIAIESLIHSSSPAATIANLVAALDPRGRLIVVDDMPLNPVPKDERDLFNDFKASWRCPVAPSADEWMALAELCQLKCISNIDLSHLMRPRTEPELDAALADLRSQRPDKIKRGFGRLSDAEIGGLHLERLLRRRTIRYVMLVFEKQ